MHGLLDKPMLDSLPRSTDLQCHYIRAYRVSAHYGNSFWQDVIVLHTAVHMAIRSQGQPCVTVLLCCLLCHT